MLHLLQIDEEGPMATYYHGIWLERLLHLLGGGTQHVGTNLTITQLADLDVVTYCLNIQ